MAVVLILYFLLIGLMIAGMWKSFEKAGEPGWASLVPFYNVYVMTQIARKEIIWFVIALFFGIVGIPVLCIAIAERFGKGAMFGIGMAFLPFIFWPMLGFGDAEDEESRRRRRRRPQSRSRDYDAYEDEDDDRPAKKKRRNVDEDDEERPSKRRAIVDVDDDRPAKKKRRAVDDDDDDDDRPAPRRRRRDDDD